MRRITMRSKLLLVVVAVALGAVAVVGALAFLSSRSTIEERAIEQLEGQRRNRADRVVDHIGHVGDETVTLGQDRMAVEALLEFRAAFEALDAAELPEGWEAQAVAFHEQVLAALPGDGNVRVALPASTAGRWVQHHYVVTNPEDRASDLDDAGDGTFYSRVHARFHPVFADLADRLDYDDLLLVEAATGAVVYSVNKRIDLGTSLLSGPFRQTEVGRLFTDVLANPSAEEANFADFSFYLPAGGGAEAFAASPVVSGDRIVGAVILEVAADTLEAVLTSRRDWMGTGLGDTGEAYLVGADGVMRSGSRQLVEDPSRYAELAADAGTSAARLDRILAVGSTTLLQPAGNESVDAAARGVVDTRVTRNYLGVEVLSTSQPLDIGGLGWVLVVEQALEEVDEPVRDLQRTLLIATGIIAFLLTAVSTYLSSRFMRPVRDLDEWSAAVRAERPDAQLELSYGAEFVDMAGSLNAMVADLRTDTAETRQARVRADQLLDTVASPLVADRLRSGQLDAFDTYPSLTVVYSRLVGLSAMLTRTDVAAMVGAVGALVSGIDDELQRHGLDKLKLSGDGYLAVCGLSEQRLDQRRRAVDFAVAVQDVVARVARRHQLDIAARIGVATGPAAGALAGNVGITYEVWGEPIEESLALAEAAHRDQVLADDDIALHLADVHRFDTGPDVTLRSGRVIESFSLVTARRGELATEGAG